SRLLTDLPWLRHQFGTRNGPLSQNGMASLKQIHSAIALRADRADECVGEGDALVTNQSGVALSVRTAHCFPILLAGPEHGAVAAIHAGWRGTAAGIVIRTLERMCREFDTDPRNVVAAVGPGIGACCYQVGQDVAAQFGLSQAGPLDLAENNIRQLREAGVQ